MAKKKSARGRKTCPSCKKTTGARTKVCACGHTFLTKRKQAARLPLDFSLGELEQLIKQKKELAKPLQALIEKHGVEVVLAEVQRMAQ